MPQTAENTGDLKLLSFNLWRGGVQVDSSRAVEAILASGADLVGLQEPEGCTLALAERLGWPFADPARHILSRLPLFDPPNPPGSPSAPYALVELRPGRFAAVANLHLNSDPSGTYAIREGAGAALVIGIERQARLPEVAAVIAALQAPLASGMPVFLLGDFNAPSHLDWTQATVGARPHLKFPLDWPVSRLIAEAGLRDSYRETHPDPLTHPGITWTPGYPHPHVKPGECLDRIDFVYAGGPAEAIDSRLIGEPGGPEVAIAVSPWPTDHRAVLSTFRVTPAKAPPMIATDRKLIDHGAAFAVRYHAPDDNAARIAVAAHHADPLADPLMSMSVEDATDRRVIVFGSAALAPGSYQLALIDRAGQAIARTAIGIRAPNRQLQLRAVCTGRSLRLDWQAAPGNRFDWIAIYRAGEADLQAFIFYRYAEARVDGALAVELPPQFAAGRYEAKFMCDDAHIVLAAASFLVER